MFEKVVLDYLSDNLNKPKGRAKREVYKQVWKRFESGFTRLARAWVSDLRNRKEVIEFYKQLEVMLKKNNSLIGLASETWEFDESLLVNLPNEGC
ncbi:hypothetical protein [Corynebacterium gottingense]|uniref:hypothetical protein n=1 Tax=Corynebacterium gottingense TaxID=2041036 RepID=UPI0011C3C7B6|nr:hypothetical protein [Corynebacterium gottingense]